MRSKLAGYFMKFVQAMLIVCLGITIFTGLEKVYGKAYIFNDIFSHPEYIVWAMVICLFAFAYCMFKWIDKLGDKGLKRFTLITFGLLVIGELIMTFAVDVIHSSDDYYVIDQALYLRDNPSSVGDGFDSLGYFDIYGNNSLVLLMTRLIVTICKRLHIAGYEKVLTLFAALMVVLSTLFLYLTVKLVKGRKLAAKVLLLCVLNPLSYLLIHWTYTCVYSIVFMTLSIYVAVLFYRANREGRLVRQIVFGGLEAFCLVFGYFLRPTILIPIIAIVLCLLFSIKQILAHGKGRQLLISGLTSLVIMVGLFAGFKAQINTVFIHQEDNFPVSYYLMLGADKNCQSIHQDHVYYEMSFETSQEKNAANLKQIKEYYKSYGLVGTLKYYLLKMPKSWNDGEALYIARITNIRKYTRLYKYLAGSMDDMLICYAQAFRLFTLIFMLIAVLDLMKKPDWFVFLYALAVFGGMVFYTFWETKTAYSFPFVPLMLLPATLGVVRFTEAGQASEVTETATRNLLHKAMIGVMVATVVFSICGYKGLCVEKRSVKNYAINSSDKGFTSEITDLSATGNVLKQDFTSNIAFDRIGLSCRKLDSESACTYTVDLCDGDRQVQSWQVDASDVSGGWLTLKVDKDAVDKNKTYTIVISGAEAGTADSLTWYNHYATSYQEYEGDTYLGDQAYANKLLLRVYDVRKGALLGRKKFLGILLLLLLGQGILCQVVGGKTFRFKKDK